MKKLLTAHRFFRPIDLLFYRVQRITNTFFPAESCNDEGDRIYFQDL